MHTNQLNLVQKLASYSQARLFWNTTLKKVTAQCFNKRAKHCFNWNRNHESTQNSEMVLYANYATTHNLEPNCCKVTQILTIPREGMHTNQLILALKKLAF